MILRISLLQAVKCPFYHKLTAQVADTAEEQIRKRLSCVKPGVAELKFDVECDGSLVTVEVFGKADCIIDEIIVVEIKSRKPEKEYKVAQWLMQLAFYKHAYGAQRAFLVVQDRAVEVPEEALKAAFEELRKNVKARACGAVTDKYVKTQSCGMCEFADVCPVRLPNKPHSETLSKYAEQILRMLS